MKYKPELVSVGEITLSWIFSLIQPAFGPFSFFFPCLYITTNFENLTWIIIYVIQKLYMMLE